MIRRPIPSLLHAAIFVIAALAFVTAGFSYKAPGKNDLLIASYQASLGVVVDLCEDHDGDGTADGGACPLCHLVSSAMLPSFEVTVLAAEARILAQIILPRLRLAAAVSLAEANPTRGPPLL